MLGSLLFPVIEIGEDIVRIFVTVLWSSAILGLHLAIQCE